MTQKSTRDNYIFFYDAKPGNIAMAAAYDVSHPAYLEEEMVSETYLVQ